MAAVICSLARDKIKKKVNLKEEKGKEKYYCVSKLITYEKILLYIAILNL